MKQILKKTFNVSIVVIALPFLWSCESIPDVYVDFVHAFDEYKAWEVVDMSDISNRKKNSSPSIKNGTLMFWNSYSFNDKDVNFFDLRKREKIIFIKSPFSGNAGASVNYQSGTVHLSDRHYQTFLYDVDQNTWDTINFKNNTNWKSLSVRSHTPLQILLDNYYVYERDVLGGYISNKHGDIIYLNREPNLETQSHYKNLLSFPYQEQNVYSRVIGKSATSDFRDTLVFYGFNTNTQPPINWKTKYVPEILKDGYDVHPDKDIINFGDVAISYLHRGNFIGIDTNNGKILWDKFYKKQIINFFKHGENLIIVGYDEINDRVFIQKMDVLENIIWENEIPLMNGFKPVTSRYFDGSIFILPKGKENKSIIKFNINEQQTTIGNTREKENAIFFDNIIDRYTGEYYLRLSNKILIPKNK